MLMVWFLEFRKLIDELIMVTLLPSVFELILQHARAYRMFNLLVFIALSPFAHFMLRWVIMFLLIFLLAVLELRSAGF